MVGRCAGAQGLAKPYHKGREVDTEHESIYYIYYYIYINMNMKMFLEETLKSWQPGLRHPPADQSCPLLQEFGLFSQPPLQEQALLHELRVASQPQLEVALLKKRL